jgi:hypothetical protein
MLEVSVEQPQNFNFKKLLCRYLDTMNAKVCLTLILTSWEFKKPFL